VSGKEIKNDLLWLLEVGIAILGLVLEILKDTSKKGK
jgi:hypothetical protein